MKPHSEHYVMELIIAKVKSGDLTAFSVLVDEHKAMAFTLALRLLKSREDAEEVTQDSFLKAYKNIGQFKEEARFSTWLYSIVYNTALTYLRKKKLKTTEISDLSVGNLLELSEPDSAWIRLQKEERAGFIKLAFSRLSGDDQLAITLFYLNENSLQEITEITNWELSNVKVRLHRARKRLLIELEKLLNHEVRTLL